MTLLGMEHGGSSIGSKNEMAACFGGIVDGLKK